MAAHMEPDVIVFEKPITLSLACPSGVRNSRAYLWDSVNDKWMSVASSRNDDKVITQMIHFSWYGIGGDPPSTGGGGTGGGGTYTTGANEDMIALITILAISAGVFILRKNRWLRKV